MRQQLNETHELAGTIHCVINGSILSNSQKRVGFCDSPLKAGYDVLRYRTGVAAIFWKALIIVVIIERIQCADGHEV